MAFLPYLSSYLTNANRNGNFERFIFQADCTPLLQSSEGFSQGNLEWNRDKNTTENSATLKMWWNCWHKAKFSLSYNSYIVKTRTINFFPFWLFSLESAFSELEEVLLERNAVIHHASKMRCRMPKSRSRRIWVFCAGLGSCLASSACQQ